MQSRAPGHGRWRRILPALGILLPAAALAQDPPEPAMAGGAVPVMIITARKIEENLQHVPLSVQLLPGELLDLVDLTHLFELQFNIPGLLVNNQGMFGAGFALRGISDQRAGGNSVAVHLDGVYQGNGSLATTRMFDLERIEVLKGPQGTLYGRNSTAGAINFIPRAPADELSAGIEAAYGSYSTTRAAGHVNLPVGDAALRLAFVASEGDGYIRNSVDERRFAEQDYWGVRASLRVDAGDALSFAFMAQHVRDDGASGELWTPNPQFLADPGDIRLATVTLADPFLVAESDNASLRLEYELGSAVLRSITGYARSRVDNRDDCAGIPLLAGCVRGASPAKHSQWSQEFQLSSSGAGSIQWLLGAYYYDADATLDFFTLAPVISPSPINDYRSTSDETTSAVFGQATLRLAEQWRLTGGLRLSDEQREMTTIGSGVQDSPTLLAGKTSSQDIDWRIDLAHEATADFLSYASVSTGHNSGGFTPTLRTGTLDDFAPERVLAYEAGLKSTWLARRLKLNAAAFFYDFDDLQVRTVALIDDQLVAIVDNAARAELYGLDAEVQLTPSDRLTLSAGAVWLPKREFVEYQSEDSSELLSGNKLVRAPEWSATAAIGYQHPVAALGWLSGRIEYNYRSSHYFTKENEPANAQDGFGILNALLKFEAPGEQWYVFVSGRNLTGEDYFTQVFLQSSPGYPGTYEVGFGCRF
jgi:iron complex outermembrane recepter protein